MKKEKIVLLHTAYPIINQLSPLLKEIVPRANVVNVLDEDILTYLLQSNFIHPEINRKIFHYVFSSQEMGASAVLLTCSSISPCADVVRPLVDIPVFKIDKPMIEKAIQTGSRIGVVATIPTTLNPTKSFIIEESRKKKKKTMITDILCDDAFNALLAGRIEEHDESVISAIKKLAGEVDVIVLAQVSMARIVPQVEKSIEIPILSSGRTGIEQLKSIVK